MIPAQITELASYLFDDPHCFDSATGDLSRVWPEFAIWMLVDPEHGVIKYAGDRQDVRAAIERVAELYRRGGTKEEFEAAAAAAAAAWATAWAAAARAAAAAWAEAAAAAAAWAAAAAAWAAAAAAARAAWKEAAKKKLTEIVNQIDKRRHRYMRLFTPHGMCEDYCVEHERDPEVEPCR